MSSDGLSKAGVPILLYDGGCATCRVIARWVHKSAVSKLGEQSIIDRPVGNDPAELRRLNPGLDIWDAYAVSHVIMPDGSMKLGGEAVAEVLRRLPSTRRLASCLDFGVLGFRPFQTLLNLAYTVLDDARPLFGCESCGRPKPWVRPLARLKSLVSSLGGNRVHPKPSPHFAPLPKLSGPRRP